MKNLVFHLLLLLSFNLFGQKKSSEIISNYGIIWDIEGVVKPSGDQPVKIIIDLKTKIDSPEKVNRGLDNVARMLNLHAAGGISIENLQFAVAVHGGATPVILNNEGYSEKFGIPNPNIDLLQKLEDVGVEVYVCSQSMITRKYNLDQVDKTVEKALSMLTIVTDKMNKGHNLMVFQ